MANENYNPDERKVFVATNEFAWRYCPVCGAEFDPVLPVNVCHNDHQSLADELISEDADYAWVE